MVAFVRVENVKIFVDFIEIPNVLSVILLSVGNHGFCADDIHNLCDFGGRKGRIHRHGNGTEHLQTEKVKIQSAEFLPIIST